MIEEIGTVWLLMMILNLGGPQYLSGNVRIEDFKAEASGKTVQTTTTGEVAFDLRPGSEKAWADFTTRQAGQQPKRLIFIMRFDTNEVYRLDPATKTYSVAKMENGRKFLDNVQKIYLGGPNWKDRAAPASPPSGATEGRICRQVKSDPYTTIFYLDPAHENAATRVDVNSKGATFAVMSSMIQPKIDPIDASKFEVPKDYTKK